MQQTELGKTTGPLHLTLMLRTPAQREARHENQAGAGADGVAEAADVQGKRGWA